MIARLNARGHPDYAGAGRTASKLEVAVAASGGSVFIAECEAGFAKRELRLSALRLAERRTGDLLRQDEASGKGSGKGASKLDGTQATAASFPG